METKEVEDRKILRHRASRLAAPLCDEVESERYIEIMTFMISGERYAISTDRVGSVSPCLSLCPLPGTPDHILGIANVYGELLPLVDIGPRFGLARGEVREDSRIIVLESPSMKFGLFAERVVGSEAVRNADLKPPLSEGRGPATHILNIMSDGTMLLNVDALLADNTLIVRDE